MARAQGHSQSEERPGGLRCPRCACPHLPVLYTRYRPQKIVRVRKCRHCGRRMITYETIGTRGISEEARRSDGERGLTSAFDHADKGTRDLSLT
jgi:transcriptional regulator NrdR family protein